VQSLNQNWENQSVQQAEGAKGFFFSAAVRAGLEHVHSRRLVALLEITSAEVVKDLSSGIQLEE
jgi:hypothetical protein